MRCGVRTLPPSQSLPARLWGFPARFFDVIPAKAFGVWLGAITGVGLGLLAWTFSLFGWFALEISLGGRVHPIVETVVGAMAGALAGRAAFWMAHRQTSIGRERFRIALLGAATLLILVVVALFLLFTGPRDLQHYSQAASSPYRLPWSAGVTRLCCQGNRAIVSHRDWEEFAFDFAMPVGSDICAVRGGLVVNIDVSHDGNGLHAANNFLVIDHGDGTFAWYLHLRKGGNYVQLGQRVRQGEPVAASGNVGHSMLPHLHFQVTDANGPLTAGDVCRRGFGRRYSADVQTIYIRQRFPAMKSESFNPEPTAMACPGSLRRRWLRVKRWK